ncbi:MAG: hypothetical protein NWT00_12215 [Beijerinckiaceae bacterium]|nr:hypothetical protein [Beijerinckiaceae bacterium]
MRETVVNPGLRLDHGVLVIVLKGQGRERAGIGMQAKAPAVCGSGRKGVERDLR